MPSGFDGSLLGSVLVLLDVVSEGAGSGLDGSVDIGVLEDGSLPTGGVEVDVEPVVGAGVGELFVGVGVGDDAPFDGRFGAT